MELNQITYAAIGALIVGTIMLFSGSKQRTELGEWSNSVQWGYLLLMMGMFGILAKVVQWSFTATLLAFTLFTGAVWVWRKIAIHDKKSLDNNNFRDYMSGFFPIIALVFVVRTFIVEPFQIPSSSMRPGLVKGDFILVNKFAYGIRLPVLNNVLINTGKVQRGDVLVFNYPVDPKINYIKRIVGVPGDIIEYKDKILTVNGQSSQDVLSKSYIYPDDRAEVSVMHEAQQYQSTFAGKNISILKEPNAYAVDAPTWNTYQNVMKNQNFESGLQQNCDYAPDGSSFTCKVPEGKYFAMGDNRDASADSRYWGFVNDNLVVGKAFLVWLNMSDMKRIGTVIQ